MDAPIGRHPSPPVDPDARIPILYLAPWVDYGGSDKGTIDWFRWIDRSEFAPSLITTQPSPNRRLSEIVPFAEEVWALPDFLDGSSFRSFILEFIESRGIQVIHLMNSRLGFCLLPELVSLRPRPAVVVQLHVEEPSRGGYVRYVTTRFGNLVDAFSLTSRHLARAVAGYGIPRDRISVIHTGVDAETEFNPQRVKPHELPDGPNHVLYAGRLSEQKDPLLMADVCSALIRRRRDVRFHVVGEGELEDELRRRAGELGLDQAMEFHPPTADLAPWYAACDVVLMTSRFEGVPYVAYEAMAMETPVVAPALPGNVELLGGGHGGLLVEDRADVDGYVDRLARLVDAPDEGLALGRLGRERVLSQFSLEQMGAQHASLYRGLLAETSRSQAGERERAPASARIALRGRPSYGRPRVSAIVACFNHGRFLPASVGSVLVQNYPDVETILVDDGSTDSETIDAVTDLAHDARVRVVRLEGNVGPARARNAGIEMATGRYVLPVDADNVLLPNAIEELVKQIQCAGERIGFIYPNMAYFGNLDLTVRAPVYNLWSLMGSNYCDTGSLFDREIFDRGFRFTGELRSGHEDWDFVLKLAEYGIYGEPARTDTVLVRKLGYTRSDRINQRGSESQRVIERERTELYRRRDAIKATWSPELSAIQLREVRWGDASGGWLAERLREQSAADFELIAPARGRANIESPPCVRRLPAGLAQGNPADVVSAAFKLARGRYVLLIDGGLEEFVRDRAFVAKLLEAFGANADLDAIVLGTSSVAGAGFGLLTDDVERSEPAAVVWRVDRECLPDPIALRVGDCVGSIVRALVRADATVEWRSTPRRSPRSETDGTGETATVQVKLPRSSFVDRIEWDEVALERRRRREGNAEPLPGMVFLCRHRELGGEIRIVTESPLSPAGYELEHTIGLVHTFSPPGTVKIVLAADGHVKKVPRGGARALEDGDRLLGSVEMVPFLLQDPLLLGALRSTGHHVLVNGVDDPLLAEVDILETLGFVEPWPLRPRRSSPVKRPYGLAGLVRGIDRQGRRHVYSVGSLPAGEIVGELGALHLEAQGDSVPLWLTDDERIGTEDYRPWLEAPGLVGATRWALAPARWWGARRVLPRSRAVGRRALQIRRYTHSNPPEWHPSGPPDGYLFREDDTSRVPLYAALHPITGDQLLTSFPLEAQDMGYVRIELLGYVLAAWPVTGTAERTRPTVPWASRFGLEARWQ